jgi:hypothetical protein
VLPVLPAEDLLATDLALAGDFAGERAPITKAPVTAPMTMIAAGMDHHQRGRYQGRFGDSSLSGVGTVDGHVYTPTLQLDAAQFATPRRSSGFIG